MLEDEDNFYSLYERAQDALDEDRAIEALECSTRMIELQPDNSNGYYMKAAAHTLLLQFAQAIPCYDRLIQMNTGEAFPYYLRGVAREETSQLEGALEDFNCYISMQPMDMNGYEVRGYLYFRMQRWLESINDFKRCIKLGYPDVNMLYHIMSLSYTSIGDHGKSDFWRKKIPNSWWPVEDYDESWKEEMKALRKKHSTPESTSNNRAFQFQELLSEKAFAEWFWN
jgi:tetratricopeptide (TPR) repeat protein